MVTDTKKGIKHDGKSRPSNEAYKNGWNEIYLNKVLKEEVEIGANGTNLNIQGDMLPKTVTTGSHTVDGITTTHHGIDLNTKPTVTMHSQGAATNLLESYHGPGLKSFTRISRDILTESVTETMSTFTQ